MNRGLFFLYPVLLIVSVTVALPVLGQEKKKKSDFPKAGVVKIKKDTLSKDTLKAGQIVLNEVIITASESKGLSTSSIIDRKAMQHLQPSSFTDLLELLPGGRSRDPNLGTANLIGLRQVGIPGKDYDISSLGTAFFIDGAPISTRANMQYTAGLEAQSDLNTKRNITGKGVDMRTLSTDQIERVEIIRGIPSVQYGDLTSGMVKITRKKGGRPLEARFKADGFSKLIYVGKGFSIPEKKITLNVDVDYLNSMSDPRDRFENFKRINTSFRFNKIWENDFVNLDLSSSVDYGTSFDNQRTDPDAGYQKVDRYKSEYKRMAFANNLVLKFNQLQFLKSVEINSALSLQRDQINQTKWVQAPGAAILNTSTEQGAHDVGYLTPQYAAHLLVDGRPVDGFLKAMANMEFETWKVKHAILLGAEGNYSKNNGRGQVFDPLFPPSIGMSSRPRAYSDIPAARDLSFFAEDRIGLTLGRHQIIAAAGVRRMTMAGLEAIDPRFNGQWTLPGITLGTQKLVIEFGGGIGWQSKFPVLDQLYPDYTYVDREQLNYFHNNPLYRKANVMTYKFLLNNDHLEPARNKKWELKTDISLHGNRLSVTYFKETSASGFRKGTDFKVLEYKKYNTSSINPDQITAPPDVKDLPFENMKTIVILDLVQNGSAISKEGVEYQFSSERIRKINTRFTLNGAWFRSVYESSLPMYKWPKDDIIIDGKKLTVLGLYPENDGYIRSQLNTNLMIDTYLPKVGLEFSASIQCRWFFRSQLARKSGTPSDYVDADGLTHPYTEADKNDPVLQWLNIKYADGLFDQTTTPVDLNVNFKAVKNFKNKVRVGMFVNRIFNYAPDYTSNGVTIRRAGLNSPYFGMELNFNL